MPKRAKILVVDDEPDILEVIEKILRDRGFEVGTAANGAVALERLAEGGYDLILSDVKMPELDGLELLQKVSLLYPEIPMVILSAFANIQDAVVAIKLGAFDYIAKPVYPDDLLLSIDRALKYQELQRATRELEWTCEGLKLWDCRYWIWPRRPRNFSCWPSSGRKAGKIKIPARSLRFFWKGPKN